jgi:hypothetical protein
MRVFRILTCVAIVGAGCGTTESPASDGDGGPDTAVDAGGGDVDGGSPDGGGGDSGDADGAGSDAGRPDGGGADTREDAIDAGPAPDAEPDGTDSGAFACGEPNPAGCASLGCGEGQYCQTVTDACIPSSCECGGEGVWICTEDCGGGICVALPECRSDDACPPGTGCADGRCQPVDCPAVEAPVCGVDGETYSNRCVAESMRVEVAYEGPCASACRGDDECPWGAATCEDGACVECPDLSEVLCGACEPGTTYLERNGCTFCDCVSTRECESSEECGRGEVCEGTGVCFDWCAAGDPACCEGSRCVEPAGGCAGPSPAGCRSTGCAEGLRCDPTAGCAPLACACDESSDSWLCTADCSGGVCVPDDGGGRCGADTDCPIGSLCFDGVCEEGACIGIYDPVCGVDGVTYGSACEAALARVEVASEGACEGAICASNRDCNLGEICYPPTMRCQEPCGPIACFVEDPVCGTDGVTYICGESDAWCAGVTVAYDGRCRDSGE